MRLLSALVSLSLVAGAHGTARAQPIDATPSDERVLIFFAWDRPIIDGDAAARLDSVAASFQRSPAGRFILSGHADRSGPSGPNMRSGRKRAEAVAAYLAARGVPAAAMTVVSHGESRPLIATQDGVREPQNRRVEIMRAPAG